MKVGVKICFFDGFLKHSFVSAEEKLLFEFLSIKFILP